MPNQTILFLFSGHGAGEQGLAFEDELGNSRFVNGDALANLFSLFASQIHCVLLNGCYSEVQAKAIAQDKRESSSIK